METNLTEKAGPKASKKQSQMMSALKKRMAMLSTLSSANRARCTKVNKFYRTKIDSIVSIGPCMLLRIPFKFL